METQLYIFGTLPQHSKCDWPKGFSFVSYFLETLRLISKHLGNVARFLVCYIFLFNTGAFSSMEPIMIKNVINGVIRKSRTMTLNFSLKMFCMVSLALLINQMLHFLLHPCSERSYTVLWELSDNKCGLWHDICNCIFESLKPYSSLFSLLCV